MSTIVLPTIQILGRPAGVVTKLDLLEYLSHLART